MKPGEERAATMADAWCFARPREGSCLAAALESIGNLDLTLLLGKRFYLSARPRPDPGLTRVFTWALRICTQPVRVGTDWAVVRGWLDAIQSRGSTQGDANFM